MDIFTIQLILSFFVGGIWAGSALALVASILVAKLWYELLGTRAA